MESRTMQINSALKNKSFYPHVNHQSDSRFDSPRSPLNDETYELWRRDQITASSQKSNYVLLHHLEELFRDIFPYAGLYLIGSTINGFGQYRSKLDLCLMVSYDTITEREAGCILQKIRDIFRRSEYFQNVKLIQRASPVLIFSDLITSTECQLFLNESMFIRNTFLLRFYAECDHRLPILVNSVKYWALKVNLKQCTQNVLNGYCLCLMCIYYLQTTPLPSPIVPRFTEFLSEEKFQKSIDIRSLNLMDAVDLAKHWVSSNATVETGDLFIGFLRFYAIDFDFPNDVISVRTGRRMSKRELTNPIDRINRSIVIEDPLTEVNITSSMASETVYYDLLQVFRTSYNDILARRHLI